MNGWERFLFVLSVSLFLWPLEALSVMWGLMILHNHGFNVPTPGYWESFIVWLGLSLVLRGAAMSRDMIRDSDNKP